MGDVIRIGHLTTTEEVETMQGVVKVFGNVQQA
jgi:putative transposon-encoded protein